jgi:hypothetical protein
MLQRSLLMYYSSLFITLFHIILICMYDVIYEAEIALCNINKQPLQLKMTVKAPSIEEYCINNFVRFICGKMQM